MSRAVSKVHAPQPEKPPAYLVKKIDKFAAKLLAHLQRPVVFRPNFN
jgi:iron-sulfur cluster repair protein YtfE (RIC family)